MSSPTTSTSTRARKGRGRGDLRDPDARHPRWSRWATGIVLLLIVGIVGVALFTSQQQTSSTARPAPDFTLATTEGGTVSLSDYRGRPVLLYFNEGAGCASCTLQLVEIEKNPGFEEQGVVVLPIVMNSADQIRADMARYGATTPYLLDDGTISGAYGTLGKGMHEGLPGHGFVLIDAQGNQRWQGNYPSMWLDPNELLDIVRANL